MNQDIAERILMEIVDMRKDMQQMEVRLTTKIDEVDARLSKRMDAADKRTDTIEATLQRLENTMNENHRIVMMNIQDQIAFNQDIIHALANASRAV